MKVIIMVYDKCKYENDSKGIMIRNQEITHFTVRYIPKDEILKETSSDGVDPYNEYLILYCSNGETSTYRNSFTDIFFY